MSDNTCTKTVLAPLDMTGEWIQNQVIAASEAGFLNFEILDDSSRRKMLTLYGFTIGGIEQRNINSVSFPFIKWRLKVQDAGDGLA